MFSIRNNNTDNTLITVIQNCETMLTPSVFDPEYTEDMPTEIFETETTSQNTEEVVIPTTTYVAKGKGKGKRSISCSKEEVKKKKKKKTGKKIDEENGCPVCSGKYDDSPDWIQCDSCNEWVHGSCVGITTSEQWEIYDDENITFFCPFCQ